MTGPADRAGVRVVAVVCLGALWLSGCTGGSTRDPDTTTAGLPQGSDPVELDAAEFSVDITNRYWPMSVGDRWVFEETDGAGEVQRVEVTVLDETYTVAAGIEGRVVHDLVTAADGGVVEDTLDWYAQDARGNVWYLGEQTAEYENGRIVSTEGSWEAGVDGAQAGIVVPAEPEPGLAYRQEYLAGEAEDQAVVLSVSEQVEAPSGTWTGALLTRDTTPLQPEIAELKFYAPGIGPVLVVQTSGGVSREALVETSRTR
jgi:hypothetical protein